MKKEDLKNGGEKIANTFRPFVSSGPIGGKDADEVVVNMGKAIQNAIDASYVVGSAQQEQIVIRVRQFLSALDYETLSDYQAKLVLLLEKEIK